MFKAIKKLRKPTTENNITVHNKKGEVIMNKVDKYTTVKNYFRNKFWNDDNETIDPFEGEQRPLNVPISKDEVEKAVKKIKNNKAAGEDKITGELIKYAPDIVKEKLSETYNKIFENHCDEINIGKSNLLPLQKPNKEKGPLKNLRPINLLNTSRKILSIITLNRIQEKVEQYLSASQAAYRPKRSTGDIVWAHRFIIGKVQLYQDLEVYITGIDMSSAFDTINRQKLMNELSTFIDEDECRIIRTLLSNTTINIQLEDCKGEEISTNIGSPQGDGISGTFFNIAFEKSLRNLRERMNTLRPEIEHSYSIQINPPKELIYADDSDFPTVNKNECTFLKSIMKDILAEDDLIVNEDKTEETTINRSNDKNEEKWRTTKKLGSLLGCHEDMKRRIQLSYAAFNNIKKIWFHRKIHINKKLQLYKSLVKPILLYNSGTWGLTKKEQNELDVTHRRQLRTVSNNKRICNKKLYDQCNEENISSTIKKNKWQLFGHILRLPKNTPANEAMEYYFKITKKMKKYSGTPRTTLPTSIDKDIKQTVTNHPDLPVKQFTSTKDLEDLRNLAQERDVWKEFLNVICSA